MIAIPHNPNLSNGMMFPARSVDGRRIDRAYAELRARWEPILEVTQVKGDSEAHPLLSPQDEFAGFETWDKDNIGRTADKEEWMLPNEYARSALKRGLGYEAELGANPFKFGMIGSTDSHTSLATAAEAISSANTRSRSRARIAWKPPWQVAACGKTGGSPPRATRRCGRAKTHARNCSPP